MPALLMGTMSAILLSTVNSRRWSEGSACSEEGGGHETSKANLQHCGQRAAGSLDIPCATVSSTLGLGKCHGHQRHRKTKDREV